MADEQRITEPSSARIMRVVRDIKAGVDAAKARGVECVYPIIVEIDGCYYSFRGCLEGWGERA